MIKKFMVIALLLLFSTSVFAQDYTNSGYYSVSDNTNVTYDSAVDSLDMVYWGDRVVMPQDQYEIYEYRNPSKVYPKPTLKERIFNEDNLNVRVHNIYEDDIVERVLTPDKGEWDYILYGNTAKPDSVDYYRVNGPYGVEHETLRVYPNDTSKFKYKSTNYLYNTKLTVDHGVDKIQRNFYEGHRDINIKSVYDFKTKTYSSEIIE